MDLVRTAMATSGLAAVVAGALAVLGGTGPAVVRDGDGCPRTVEGVQTSIVDWVPLVAVGDQTMYAVSDGPTGGAVPGHLVGEHLLDVRCSYGEDVQTPSYQPREGEATYLPVGTPVHAVVGVDTTFEVVALTDDGPVLHRRDLPPAEVGAATDVVPLSPDDVTGVALRSEHDGTTELGRLDGAAADVTVEQLRAAEVGLPLPEFTGPRVFVALERGPLPALVLVVDVESGITTEGLRVPDDLLSALRAVV